MADRDPETIKRDIDQARDQLASQVDQLAGRAIPQRCADAAKAGVVALGENRAGVGHEGGTVVVVLVIRRVRRR